MTDSQAWDTDPERLIGLADTKACKSEFPDSVVNGRGPLVDCRRVKSGRPRLGFGLLVGVVPASSSGK